MPRTSSRAWAMTAAAAAALVAASVAGAGHDATNVFHLGSTNTFGNANVVRSADGQSVGYFEQTAGTNIGVGVRGYHSSSAGTGPGVLGDTDSQAAGAVGVLGRVNSQLAVEGSAGVVGETKSQAVATFGVLGRLNSPFFSGVESAAVRGIVEAIGGSAGVWGSNGTAEAFGTGVRGDAAAGAGVYGLHSGTTGAEPGVRGQTNSTAANAKGVEGIVSPTTPGASSAGVYGVNNGTSGPGIGVWGEHKGGGWGVYGTSPSGLGVFGFHSGTAFGHGVRGLTNSTGANAAGVSGEIASAAANAAGVRGQNMHSMCCGMGVAGFHSGAGIGVYGEALNGFAVSGFSPNNWSGYFQGSVRVVGNLQKNSGSFTIDHPLDPENRYLSHSFVESPDMKNVYDGFVRTDRRGFATVKLPRYFGALNRDFRYQLTVIGKPGEFVQAMVVEKITNNRFKLQTSKPDIEVSWQVTGIRKDRWANAHRIVVEETKKPSERGKYLNPELYGKPPTMSVVVLPGSQRTER